jgi:3-hydroxy-9,10-secoandrosta-1,3,5(10)-triene-9,17-dione monooxygenase reductase component
VHAEVFDVHVAGDHDVVLGRVLEVELLEDEPPMIFYRGGFGVQSESTTALDEPALWGWGDHWG